MNNLPELLEVLNQFKDNFDLTTTDAMSLLLLQQLQQINNTLMNLEVQTFVSRGDHY